MEDAPDPEPVLDLLGDEHVRSILVATSSEELSAKELAEECGVAVSTIYRRAEEMEEHGLLVEHTAIEPDGSHHSVYRANVNHLEVDVEEGQIEVAAELRESPSERFTRVWNGIRESR